MKKHLSFCGVCLILLIMFVSASISSQPMHYNYNTTGGANSFPFNQAAGKCIQTLALPGEFTVPSPAPEGNITKFYVRIAATYPLGPATYSQFKIIMYQTALTALSGNWYTTDPDTVYQRASVTLTASAESWLGFELDHPFSYNPAQSLIVQIEQCGVTGTYTGFSLSHTTVTGSNRRSYSVGGCPYVYSGVSALVVNCGIDVAPPTSLTPDYLFYKFENNPSPTTVINCADPGVGTQIATLTSLTLTPGGQFDTCITGTGLASAKVTTGYNWNMGSSSWTISMWLTIPSTNSGSAYYLFGDAGSGSFRCFHNGVAGQDNLVLRGTGITDVNVTGIGPAPTVVTFVYDSAAANIKAYKNGVLANTVNQTPLNMTTGTGFSVGGYTTSTSFIGKMDEFRLWKKALTASEVANMWDEDIACGIIVNVSNNNNQIPNSYTLYQNYPNPFNPVTDIKFAIPKSGDVEIKVFDMLGREVAVIVNEFLVPGTYKIKFDASKLSSGVYIYKIKTVDFTDSKKMILIK